MPKKQKRGGQIPYSKQKRPKLGRDLSFALAVASGYTIAEVSDKFGISHQAGSEIMARPDVQGIMQGVLRLTQEYLLVEQAKRAPAVMGAFDDLIEARDPYTTNAYLKRMLPLEPGTDVNIQKLEIKTSPGLLERLKLQAPSGEDDANTSSSTTTASSEE